MLPDRAIHTSLIQKRPRSYQSKHYMCFCYFWGAQDYRSCIKAAVNLVLQYQLSNICDLVIVMIFSFRIIKCGWFFVLGIIASNFLNIGNGWASRETCYNCSICRISLFSPSFLKTLDLIILHIITYFFRKNTHLLSRKEIDDSTENMSGIANAH